MKLPDDEKPGVPPRERGPGRPKKDPSAPKRGPGRPPKAAIEPRSVATPPGAETELAECEYAIGVLRRELGVEGPLSDLVDEAQGRLRAHKALLELCSRARAYIRPDVGGEEQLLSDALVAACKGERAAAPAGAAAELLLVAEELRLVKANLDKAQADVVAEINLSREALAASHHHLEDGPLHEQIRTVIAHCWDAIAKTGHMASEDMAADELGIPLDTFIDDAISELLKRIATTDAQLGELLDEGAKRLGANTAASAPAAQVAARWDLHLMGRTIICGIEGFFDGAGMFVATDGRRWGPGAIFEACPAPALTPVPGRHLDGRRGLFGAGPCGV